MSIDGYYTQIGGKWVRKEMPVVNGEYIADEPPDFHTDFWVDVAWGDPFLIDERYYFPDLASALNFYSDGWKQRRYLCPDTGKPVGLDHSGLYSRGRLVHGLSIHGDPAQHEGEDSPRICGASKEDR